MELRELRYGFSRAAAGVTPRQADWLAVASTLGVAVLKLSEEAEPGHLVAALVLLPVATVPLLWRRSHPGGVLIVLMGAFAAAFALDRVAPSNVGLLFALYAAARYGSQWTRVLSGALAALITATPVVMLIATGSGRVPHRLTIAVAVGMGAAWLLGELTRTRRGYIEVLEERTALLARDRGEHARRAAEAERSRIARELHDVVTHNVSVIAVQADAANIAAQPQPERTTEALELIQKTARETLNELRALLGVLRMPTEHPADAPLRPAPSLAELEDLVVQAEAAGIDVTVAESGDRQKFDAQIELAAYRLIQEALTNAVRHAPGSTAHVNLRYTASQLEVEIRTHGGASAPGDADGFGLIGLKERMQLLGGVLDAGSDRSGTFTVRGVIPLPRLQSHTLGAYLPASASTARSE
jgi:signal transduction histidine kinase